MEQGLEFRSPVGTDGVNAKGEFLYDVVDESDCIFLIVTGIDF